MSVTITLARDVVLAAPDRGTVRVRTGQTWSIEGEISWPNRPYRDGIPGPPRWSLWEGSDPDWSLLFRGEDVAALECPDTPAWRAFWAEHVPPFPVTYRPPALSDREPDRTWCLPAKPRGDFAVGDVIRVVRPDGYQAPYPPPWEGEVVEARFHRPQHPTAPLEWSYRLRLERSTVVVSDRHLEMYGARLELVRAGDPRDEEDQPQ